MKLVCPVDVGVIFELLRKIKLFADMDAATPPDSIIASSSSGLTMSVMQSACKHPERCVIGHPFNPPHVVPLVEVVAGEKTSPETVQRAIAFYASIGKKPIHVRKEVVGHVANRLQAALYREIVYLIEQGVLDVADSDAAVCWGPGLRWGLMGPNLLFHLGGGPGGIHHFMDSFMDQKVFAPLGMQDSSFFPGAERARRIPTMYTLENRALKRDSLDVSRWSKLRIRIRDLPRPRTWC